MQREPRLEKVKHWAAEERLKESVLSGKDYPGKQEDMELIRRKHRELSREQLLRVLDTGGGGVALSSHQCSGVKPNGHSCERIVRTSFSYCYSHDPARLEERRSNAAKAGKGNSQRELKRLKGKLQRLLDDVLEGRIDTSRAAVAANVSNALSRVYSVGFKARELEELEARLEELEVSMERQGERQSYGA